MSTFRDQVFKIVKQIPFGQVATYGQVAAMMGKPRAARQVGYALHSLKPEEQDVPWWRVVNAQGRISINQGQGGVEKDVQKGLLEGEGLEINDDYMFDLKKYLWVVN